MRRMTFFLPFVALAAAPALAAPADPVLKAAQAARADQLKLLKTLVNIDSGTGDKVGGQKASELVATELRALGMSVDLLPAELPTLPDNVVATLKGTGTVGKGGRILMIAHTDTVFGPGTVAKRPFRIDGSRAYGPGVIDEKGGVVEGIMALRLLKTLKQTDFAPITFLIETSEERGSPGTRALIDRLLVDADVELNLEPGDVPDLLTVWRKGSNVFRIDVKGRPSHAGVAPQMGRNAAVELIHQIDLASTLPNKGDGLTSNLTLMSAGSRNNIIPEDASATFSVRVRESRQADETEALFRRNATNTIIPDTKVTVTREVAFPPLPINPATEALAETATKIYARIGGVTLGGGNGGASESALAHAKGVPALDGLGPVGAGSHTEDEYLDLQTLTPRLYLLTRLLIEMGKKPPARIK
ncbi:glutamate carboxypeptidase [Sphingomonas psychrolutea]|uniref:Glutamate carboxypeptidase n=2 Tax=Sphingomonas psychrolutea TaxID=1259676 RepID=A0ABQ1GDE0_9SPHN|nr:glutamate carboxypeptidase [Sphingomonas psychrolutea]